MRMTGRRLARGEYRAAVGRYYGTPKEVWGFRTRASPHSVAKTATDFLAANRSLFELEEDLSNLALRKVIRSLGAEHVIYNQWHAGLRVHRAYVTVHLDRARRVYLS